MRLFAIATTLCALFAAIHAYPLKNQAIAKRDFDFTAFIQTYDSWTPEHKTAFLESLDPHKISADIYTDIAQLPFVAKRLQGQELTATIFESWINKLREHTSVGDRN
ncbi:hypothetical protein DFH07DRAFT_766646 [Mycena maculata]|uniref:Uncharacterized protein n=1 Tax=Mycena maculata TaxID=230809 RepID=A0AAD7NUV3_9AGAR|nr:hypothetical protein DFH07DRAFT_766646 [Mycena maculata]